MDWRRVGGGIFLIGFAPWLFGFWRAGFLLALVGLLIWAIASIVRSTVQELKAPQANDHVRTKRPTKPAPIPREAALRAKENGETVRRAQLAVAPAFAEAAPQPPPPPKPPAGWYPDPHKRYEQRYWDGSEWTDSVLVNGESILEPPRFS